MKTQWLSVKKQYWDNITPRERTMLKLAAAFLLPVMLYFMLWTPAHSAVKKLRNQLPVLALQADRLQAQAADIDALRHRAQLAPLNATDLKTVIEKSAVQHQLRDVITSLDAQEPGQVRMTSASMVYASWLNWLRAMQQEQHIRVESAHITRLPQEGLVKINATFVVGSGQ